MYTNDWDETKPIDHTKFIQQPGHVRTAKTDIAERLKNMFYGFISGETYEAIKQLWLRVQTSITQKADHFILYSKDVDAKAELHGKDEDGNEIQLTKAGGVHIPSLKIASEAQGDILIRDASGWTRLPAGAAGKFLKTAGAGADPSWDTPAVSGAEHLIARGFELTYKTAADLYVEPGTLYHGSTKITKTARTILTLATGADWIDGSAPASLLNIWAYVYVDSSGNIKFHEDPPDKADTAGNTVGTLLYYYYAAGTSYWRVIGAVRTDGSGNIKKFWNDQDTYYYDVPQEATTTASAGSWTALSLSNFMPAISKFVILNCAMTGGSFGTEEKIWVRPTGATWSTDERDSLLTSNTNYQNGLSGDEGIAAQVQMVTNGSQSVDYQTAGTNCRIAVVGYRLNIR